MLHDARQAEVDGWALSIRGARLDISTMQSRRLTSPILVCLVVTACGRSATEDGTGNGSPAAAMVPVPAGLSLGRMLELLDRELEAALADGVGEGEATERLIQAENITDRLLDSRIPYEWLNREQYSVEARLRQIQALADRVIAQIRIREPWTAIIADARTLRENVQRLRAGLAEGGGAAPPPLQELLASDSAGARPAPRPDTMRN